ncbi:hypothetical protein HanHA300_Chr02g0047531 [Helianthus annuus]|nr:hypothetical protein HanHA300_Chr02g0047531 [Helianthus annuus]
MSSLSFLAKLMHLKVMSNLTNSYFDQLLRDSLPKQNKIPASYYQAKKKLRKIGLGYKSIHACKIYPASYYSSWKNVDAKYKKAILATIAHYFDIKSFQNTEHWDAIKESIQVECASRFKDRKSGMKNHFDRHGGYKDVEEAKRHPPPPSQWIQKRGVSSLMGCSQLPSI